MENKTCSKCKVAQPVSSFTLYKTGKLAGKYRSHCRTCSSAQVKDWSRRNKAHLLARQRRYYVENYKMSIRAHMVRYGKNEEWYLATLEKQHGLCAICELPERAKRKDGKIQRLCVDHDHRTGVVRGLLCTACNNRLGMLEKHEWIPKAQSYLTQYQPS
jgi:hypothetical protein